MQQPWQVSKNYFGEGRYIYQVYRIINPNEPEHSGNRIVRMEAFNDKASAQCEADRLNKEAQGAV